MSINLEQLKSLLSGTQVLINNQKRVEELKGEKFNIFSILKMESNEVYTHSAFIGELLKENGSHQMGNIFLKLFIEMLLENDIPKLENHIDTNNTKLYIEKSIGARDDKKQEGGRLDLLLKDSKGKTICIENKIYAEDQNGQLVRYYKYNTKNNILFYLTLFGEDVKDIRSITLNNDSLKDESNMYCVYRLEESKHYHLLSYKKDITNWLKKCLKESSDKPILRESIKQYLLLIQKLTNTMDDKEQKALEHLIINNVESARVIRDNFGLVVNKLRENIREMVFEKLSNALLIDSKNKYTLEIEEKIGARHSKIWIRNTKGYQKLFFGIETFSGDSNALYEGNMFVGLFLKEKYDIHNKNYHLNLKDTFWQDVSVFNFRDKPINLFDADFLKFISNESIKNEMIEYIVEESANYIKRHIDFVNDELKITESK